MTKKIIGKTSVIVLLFTLMVGISSCVSYSFTGASIPPEAKTISIQYIDNQASFVVPTLSESLTTEIKDRFSSQTSLVLVRNNGDLQIEGFITDYSTSPQAVTSNEQAALNRLNISVKIKFTNLIEPDKNYETTFSRYNDYPSSQDLNSVQDAQIEIINEMLVDDIFNKAVVNW
ncbi:MULTISPECIES: LptE family protein [unclassified Lentimicrobium]|uniref:LptE family protein n=1 Tax=unclassified Lentimicrobium TaxID=2677434 RepID=UPI00155699F4|nr:MULTISPECIES: LptE family protein [unclassified Lentimicrobium]NPD45828.1 LptE family protein [Lentimicrobium sp. S6]NPD85807.1 LptE family protein [Lentimicrobium sp. L6]